MIIEMKQRTVDGMTYNYLFSDNDYYAVGYDPKTLEVKLFTPENEPIGANLETASALTGFGASTYEELIAESNRLKLIFPSL